MRLPQPPPPIDQILAGLEFERLAAIVAEARPIDQKGRYLHWDEMQYRQPPTGLTREEWWLGVSLSRGAVARPIPLLATDSTPFTFATVDSELEMLHKIDRFASGQILSDEVVTNLTSSDRYLISSLAEEAITSSQLEGASTTRRVAKEMLQTGRRPRTKDELMIANNFNAMVFAQEHSHRAFTPDDVLELHRLLTDGTLDDPIDAGRLQTSDEERVHVGSLDGDVLHRPPPAGELPERLETLCRFAAGETTEGFMHPVVRAILVHFWLAHDHPFVDGNGRTARALFYWTMLREGYWLAQYLSISSILRKSPNKYTRSYLFVETDRNDTTYFIVYQLGVILRAIDSLYDYLKRKVSETREIEAMLQNYPSLNHRQIQVIGDALRDPLEPFTIRAQANRNRVTYESARSDLRKLVALGLFRMDRVGRKHVFRPVTDLAIRLKVLNE